jgi:hypothetical protein
LQPAGKKTNKKEELKLKQQQKAQPKKNEVKLKKPVVILSTHVDEPDMEVYKVNLNTYFFNILFKKKKVLADTEKDLLDDDDTGKVSTYIYIDKLT